MVKKFTANCDINGSFQPFTLYIGLPYPDAHPLMFQSRWLASERRGIIPAEIMDSFEKLQKISKENKIAFEDLCEYVIDQLNSSKSVKQDVDLATSMQDSLDTKNQDKNTNNQKDPNIDSVKNQENSNEGNIDSQKKP